MDKYSILKYIEERVNIQIEDYKEKSKLHKKRHQKVFLLSTIVASLVSLVAALEMVLGSHLVMQIFTALLGALVVFSNTYEKSQKNSEKSSYYKSLLRETEKEKYMFLGKTGTYKDLTEEQAETLFVNRCESIFDEIDKVSPPE